IPHVHRHVPLRGAGQAPAVGAVAQARETEGPERLEGELLLARRRVPHLDRRVGWGALAGHALAVGAKADAPAAGEAIPLGGRPLPAGPGAPDPVSAGQELAVGAEPHGAVRVRVYLQGELLAAGRRLPHLHRVLHPVDAGEALAVGAEAHSGDARL